MSQIDWSGSARAARRRHVGCVVVAVCVILTAVALALWSNPQSVVSAAERSIQTQSVDHAIGAASDPALAAAKAAEDQVLAAVAIATSGEVTAAGDAAAPEGRVAGRFARIAGRAAALDVIPDRVVPPATPTAMPTPTATPVPTAIPTPVPPVATPIPTRVPAATPVPVATAITTPLPAPPVAPVPAAVPPAAVPAVAPAQAPAIQGSATVRGGPAAVVNQIPGSAWRWLDAYGWTVEWRQGPGPGRISEAQYSTSTIVIWYETSRSNATWAGAFAHELGHAVSFVHFGNQQMNEWNGLRGLSSWRWVPGTANDFSVGEGDFAESFMSYLIGHQIRSVGGPLSAADRAWIAANTPF